jgi:hypothetical protein
MYADWGGEYTQHMCNLIKSAKKFNQDLVNTSSLPE